MSAPVSISAASCVSSARIETALGNPTPRPVPDRLETKASDQRCSLTLRGSCAVRYPALSHLVLVEVGREGLVSLSFTPDQAEAFAAALVEHAKYTRAAGAWVDAEAAK